MLNDLFFSTLQSGLTSPTVLSAASGSTAGGVYMAKLGDYMFSLDTAAFQQLQRETAYRWAVLNRIGRAPARQFTGLGDDQITLNGVIYPHFRGGLGQLGLLRASAARGEPLALVYGFERAGQYCGRWVISKVHEGRTEFFQNGAPRKIEFSLQLEAYGDDADATASASVDAVTTALIPDGVTLAVPVPSLLGGLGKADSLIASAGTIASLPSITSVAGNLPSGVAALTGLGTTASGMLTNALASLTSTAQALQNNPLVKDSLQSIQQLRTAAKQGIQLVQDTQLAIAVVQASAADVKNLGNNLTAGMKTVLGSAVVNGGNLQAAAVIFGAKPHSQDIVDATRMQTGAALSNAKRAADTIIFTAAETARQATELAGKITA